MSIFLHIAREGNLLPKVHLIKALSEQETATRAGRDKADSQAGDAAAEITSAPSLEPSHLYQYAKSIEQYNPKDGHEHVLLLADHERSDKA